MLNRILKGFVAQAVAEFAPLPTEVAEDLWVLDRRVSFPGGAQLPIRSTIVRLKTGSVVVISAPPNVDAKCVAKIESIGAVKELVAPNTFHYVFVPEFLSRFPSATLFVAPGLRERVKGLPRAQDLGSVQPEEWKGELEFVILRGAQHVSEVIFFHIPSGCLILTDLVFNILSFNRVIDKITWRLSGIPAGFGPGRTSRKLLLRDPLEVFRCLTAMLKWPIQQLVVAHGDMVRDGAKAQLQQALSKFAKPSVAP